MRSPVSDEFFDRIDSACDAFEAVWKKGDRPQLEAYLSDFSEHEHSAVFTAMLAVELEYRRRFGDAVTMAEYAARFPQFAKLLTEVDVNVGSQADSGSVADLQDTSRPTLTVGYHSGRQAFQNEGRTESDQSSFFGFQLPRQFGRFEVQRTLGEGAMGAVYLAYDTRLGRNVALKIPKVPRGDDSGALERFAREARSAATLRHPNICPVYDADCLEGIHFIAMAYIEGQPLSSFINPASLPSVRNATLVIRKIAVALLEAHKQGIVHRDLKPANIMIDGRNEPIVMDFGLARTASANFPAVLDSKKFRAIRQSSEHTRQGAVVGTPRYMSPEQARGDQLSVGPASDIFSLGVIFYELLTGQAPFHASSFQQLLREITEVAPANPRSLRGEIPPELERICLKMISKHPSQRHASMKEVAEELLEALKAVRSEPSFALDSAHRELKPAIDSSSPKRRVGRISAISACGALLTGLLVSLWAALPARSGTVVVAVGEQGADVYVVNPDGIVEVIQKSGPHVLSLPVAEGPHRLVITKEGFHTFTEEFALRAGEKKTIRTHLVPDAGSGERSSDSPDVERAEWLFSLGARVTVIGPKGAKAEITRTAQLPPPPWKVTDLAWDSKDALPLLSSHDTSRLKELSDVKAVEIKGQRIESIEWLTELPGLRRLVIEDCICIDDAVLVLERLPRLRKLFFRCRGVSPEALRFLRGMPELEELWLNAHQAGDEGAAHLSSLENLKTLVIWSANVSDAGLVHLAGLRQLEQLQVGGNSRIVGPGVKCLTNLPIRNLSFFGTRIDDEALNHLPSGPLSELSLGETRVTDAGMFHLSKLTSLSQLNLEGTAITSAGVSELATLTGLRALSLKKTAVDDTALAALSRLMNLRKLDLRDTCMSENAVARLRQRLQDCSIEHEIRQP